MTVLVEIGTAVNTTPKDASYASREEQNHHLGIKVFGISS